MLNSNILLHGDSSEIESYTASSEIVVGDFKKCCVVLTKLVIKGHLQCFDTVGLAVGRAPDL